MIMFQWIKNIYQHGPILKLESFDVDVLHQKVKSNPSFKVEFVQDTLLQDSFQLHIYSDYTLRIRFGSKRSRHYAFLALQSMSMPLCVGIYEGGPDFEIRGIIEGFYGTPWSHEDRKDVIRFIHQYRMNSYFYAPKDDLYHRELWRNPYPDTDFSKITELVNLTQELDVDFYFCISPGKDFIYTNDEEFEILFSKLDQLINLGVSTFALLMDDIDYKLEGESLSRFQRPGIAHAYISNQLFRHLKRNLNHPKLVMCPTEYAQNVDSAYRQDLAADMDSDIMVFWTGYNTVAEFIPNLDGSRAVQFFKHPLILWDNYPVNDMAKDRLFMGPIRNRGKKLNHTHIGMVSNPMVEWHLSKPAVITMAMYMWDVSNYNPEVAYIESILSLVSGNHENAKHLKTFMDENYDSLIYERPSALDQMIENLDYLSLQTYFDRLVSSIKHLESHPFDIQFINQAKPWFERIKDDAQLFIEIKDNRVNQASFERVLSSKHNTGSQVILKLGIRLGWINADQIPKKRMIFWELKAPQL